MAKSSARGSILCTSKEIKKLILSRVEEFGVSLYWMCHLADIDYQNFKTYYINTGDPGSRSCKLNEDNLIKLLDLLGVSVRVTAVVKKMDDFDLDGLKQTLWDAHYITKLKNAEYKDDKEEGAPVGGSHAELDDTVPGGAIGRPGQVGATRQLRSLEEGQDIDDKVQKRADTPVRVKNKRHKRKHKDPKSLKIK